MENNGKQTTAPAKTLEFAPRQKPAPVPAPTRPKLGDDYTGMRLLDVPSEP